MKKYKGKTRTPQSYLSLLIDAEGVYCRFEYPSLQGQPKLKRLAGEAEWLRAATITPIVNYDFAAAAVEAMRKFQVAIEAPQAAAIDQRRREKEAN